MFASNSFSDLVHHRLSLPLHLSTTTGRIVRGKGTERKAAMIPRKLCHSTDLFSYKVKTMNSTAKIITTTTTTRNLAWTKHIIVNKTKSPDGEENVDDNADDDIDVNGVNNDINDDDSISDIDDDDGSKGFRGALNQFDEGLSSELPEDPRILYRMQALLRDGDEPDTIISKSTQLLFMPPRDSKPSKIDSIAHAHLHDVAASRLQHIQAMLGELEFKRQGDATSYYSSGSHAEVHTIRTAPVDGKHSGRASQTIFISPPFTKDNTPLVMRKHSINKDGKSNRPAPPMRIHSAINLTNDDQISAREIRAIIHAKTKSTPSSRRHSIVTAVSPDLPAALRLGRQTSSTSSHPAKDRLRSTTPFTAPILAETICLHCNNRNHDDNNSDSIMCSTKGDVEWNLPVVQEVSFRKQGMRSPQKFRALSPRRQSVPPISATTSSHLSSFKLVNVDFFSELG